MIRLRSLGLAALALLALALPGTVLPSSVAAQELQVPLDESGRLEVVDFRLARQLELWVDRYPGFQEARLYQAPDSTFVLDVVTSQEGRLSRHRVPLTAAEVAELRRDVSQRLAVRAPSAVLDQSGRYLLLAETAILGFAFYGPMVPTVLDVDDFSTATGLYLLTAGSSFFLPYLLTQDKPVTYAMAGLSGYGASRGLLHGLLLHGLIFGEDGSGRGARGTALLTSVAEGIGGYVWAGQEQLTPGTVGAMAIGGDYGMLGGLGLVYLVAGDDFRGRGVAGVGLAGAGAGIVGGRMLAARRDYTAGDTWVIYTAGLVGTLTGGALADILGMEDRPLVGTLMLGGATGLFTADYLVRDTDFTLGQAALNALATGGGALVGLGATVLFGDTGDFLGGGDVNEKAVLMAMALGSVGGFAATYVTLAPAARERQGEEQVSWSVQVDPRGVVGLAGGNVPSGGGSVPLFSVQARF